MKVRSALVTAAVVVLAIGSVGTGEELKGEAADATPLPAAGADDAGGGGKTNDLAKKLQNPIANLISVPLQYNADFGGGPGDDGERQVLNVQPVVPFSIGTDWNLITRTIVPVVYQDGIIHDEEWTQFGLGDTVTEFLLFSEGDGAEGIDLGRGTGVSVADGDER